MGNINRVLIIAGMHRSGTSLTAQWISKCGLHLGERLLGSSPGNKFGHVEDIDFLELHSDILAHFGKDYDVEQPLSGAIPQRYVDRARALVTAKNMSHQQWGWKEPRTCLFLSLWDELLEHPRYLVVYRDYAEVVDSILRREYKTIGRRRNIMARYFRAYQHRRNITDKANHYLRVWIAYNEALVAFVASKEPEEEYVLLKHDELQGHSNLVLDRLIEGWKFNIDRIGMEEVFHQGHMKKDATGIYNFDPELVLKARSVTTALEERALVTNL